MIAETPSTGIAANRNDTQLLETVIPRIGYPGPISVYVEVEDVDANNSQIAAVGADIIEPIWDALWGLRQFTVLDLDGNLTTFHAA